MPVSIPRRSYDQIANDYSGRIVILEGVEGGWVSYKFERGQCSKKRKGKSFEELGFQFDLVDCKNEMFLPERCNMAINSWSMCIQESLPDQDNYVKKLNNE